MHVAVATGNTDAVELLRRHGALLDVVAAWDLGWRDAAAKTLRERPEQVNRRHGSWATTPLHTAVQRGDIDLARLVLSAHPDLTLTDSAFGSTPLGWAKHLGHDDIASLIEGASLIEEAGLIEEAALTDQAALTDEAGPETTTDPT
jgi:ankyrin repeat protein